MPLSVAEKTNSHHITHCGLEDNRIKRDKMLVPPALENSKVQR